MSVQTFSLAFLVIFALLSFTTAASEPSHAPEPSALPSPSPLPLPSPHPAPPSAQPEPSPVGSPSMPAAKICVNVTQCGRNQFCNSNYTCECIDFWFGKECDIHCMANDTCSGQGTCASDGHCVCDGLWQGEHCHSKWLQITLGSILAALGVAAIVMIGCFIRNALASKRTGYSEIN